MKNSKRVIVKVVGNYIKNELPLGLITTAIRSEYQPSMWSESRLIYACSTISGIGVFCREQDVVEITDKNLRFVYYMNGPFVDDPEFDVNLYVEQYIATYRHR